MSGEIRKIKSIKSMAVYKDFSWDKSIRDSGNNVEEFKEINIFYGRNYSGKTTLSRIFRALETGLISEKYDNPEFNIEIEDEDNVNQDTIKSHNMIVRVFNEDFVKDNLRFVIDEEYGINSFAILGDDNTTIEEEIKKNELELGSEKDFTGLYRTVKDATTAFNSIKKRYDDAYTSLNNKLRDKANKAGIGIKHNKIFGSATYNVPKLEQDIEKVIEVSYVPLSDADVDKLSILLKEEAKPTIPQSENFNLNFDFFSQKTKLLVEKQVSVSESIAELLNDAILQNWVREGRELHETRRTKCGFCGGDLPKDLWDKLDKHFNEESEQLRVDIKKLLTQIESEKSRTPKVITINSNDFYSNFVNDIAELRETFELVSTNYRQSLQELVDLLNKRLLNIFNPIQYVEPENLVESLNNIRERYENNRKKSNDYTASLNTEQKNARLALRLHEVHSFIVDINYLSEREIIGNIKEDLEKAESILTSTKESVKQKQKVISELKAQLKDESKGADRVNDFLNHFFGHKSLCLKAVENLENEEGVSGYRFEVIRSEKKAYHLSEGECSLIAFCYFMAKLEDIQTKNTKPIIWIDDPISSLDANHIFFVYSLLNSEIIKKENYKQIFLSTHNLDFLKYLKRLPGAENRKKSRYFILQRNSESSDIQLMPKYLKDYVTEFNYLFHQIYKCANADSADDSNHDCYYNFGNNLRKFLEAFLYYKYPDARNENAQKLAHFFGDDALASSLTDRINNEYSHLAGVFERSITPIDVPEMKKVAEFVLSKIKEKDIDQYNALLLSIGEIP